MKWVLSLSWGGKAEVFLPSSNSTLLHVRPLLTSLYLPCFFLLCHWLLCFLWLVSHTHTHTHTRARTDAVKELQLIQAESLACLSLNIIAVASEASLWIIGILFMHTHRKAGWNCTVWLLSLYNLYIKKTYIYINTQAIDRDWYAGVILVDYTLEF